MKTKFLPKCIQAIIIIGSKTHKTGCKRPMDIAFLVDESGSVCNSDNNQVLDEEGTITGNCFDNYFLVKHEMHHCGFSQNCSELVCGNGVFTHIFSLKVDKVISCFKM